MNKTKVSIIIPAYNSQDTIKETVLSCINQTYSNIQIIVVDDGSKDKTLQVLKQIEDERLIVKTQPNKGACAARNFGLNFSTGDYIQYLDADDLLSPEKLENQLKLFNGQDGKVIASCAWGRFHNTIADFKLEDSLLNKSFSNPLDWLLASWNGKGMIACSAWLTPKELISNAGPWNESLKINQDGEFFSRVLLQSTGIVYCPLSKVYYRSSNTNSISKAPFTETKALSLLRSYSLYAQNVPEQLKTQEVKQALARNFAEVIYRFDKIYPLVSKNAWSELAKLEVNDFEPVGGKALRKLAELVGFKRAIQIRNLLNFKKKL